MQKAQNESSPFGTNSFLTDAIRPFRKSLFNSSFALPCPLAGIWMNSNAMARFSKNIFVRGYAPEPRVGWLSSCSIISRPLHFVACARPSLGYSVPLCCF